MKQKVVGVKRRLLFGVLGVSAAIAGAEIANGSIHPRMTILWHIHRDAPIAIGGGIGFLVVYLAIKLKQRILKMPEGLESDSHLH